MKSGSQGDPSDATMPRANQSKELKHEFDRLFKFRRLESGKFGFHLRTSPAYGHLVTIGKQGMFTRAQQTSRVLKSVYIVSI